MQQTIQTQCRLDASVTVKVCLAHLALAAELVADAIPWGIRRPGCSVVSCVTTPPTTFHRAFGMQDVGCRRKGESPPHPRGLPSFDAV